MLDFINNIVWGTPLLIFMLGTGCIYSLGLRFFQIGKFPYILKNTLFSLFRGKSDKETQKRNGVSQFKGVSAALAASMGTGNIAGVAAAITMGGAGAIFWMWVSAVLGMALAYAENYLGVLYRRKKNGRWYGGPMAYLEYGAGYRTLSIIFAFCCGAAALGMGNMVQVNTISTALNGCFGVPVIAVGAAAVLLCGAVVSGGIKRIGSVTQILIPFLSLVYMGAAVFIIIRSYEKLPHAFSEIFSGAFGIRSVGGGISGELIRRSVSAGLRRGVFSNEAGLGSSAVIHSSVDSDDPAQMGMWAVFEVFLDTIVCCTVTALVILTTDTADCGKEGILLVTEAFRTGIGGFAPYFITASAVLFAFATIIGWFYCGECAVVYISGEEGIRFYKVIFLCFVFVGAVARLEVVWTASDIFNGLMAIPNLIGLLMLRKKVVRCVTAQDKRVS